MLLKQTLKEKKELFIKKWFQATIDTYPADAARVLGKDANRFDNPIGSTTREALESVFEYILEGHSQEIIEEKLDPVLRIRAVQSFTAAQAVGFVFTLKTIGEKLLDKKLIMEFHQLVDLIALAAFNRLMKCKEEIFLLKATESKRRIHSAFERAGLVAELTEEELLSSDKS